MNRATIFSRAVFALLVIATFTAFFVAQRLKRADAPISVLHLTEVISPNRDGVKDRARIVFKLGQTDQVSIDVVDRAGRSVRSLIDGKRLAAGTYPRSWNGRDDDGRRVPDGSYRLQLALTRRGRSVESSQAVRVDTTPPDGYVRSVSPQIVTPDRRTVRAKVIYHGGVTERRAQFLVYRVRGGQASERPVASFMGSMRRSAGLWDGTVGGFERRVKHCYARRYNRKGRKRPAPAGTYVIAAKVCDAAGNEGSIPEKLPPTREHARGRPGVTVRYLDLGPVPLTVRPGSTLSVRAASLVGRFRYTLREVGGDVVARGSGRPGWLSLRVPRAASGIYVLTASRGRHRASVPVVLGRNRPAPVLVVLPSIAWVGGNQADSDRDGFGDTLSSLAKFKQPPPAPPVKRRAEAINLQRPMIAGRLPAGFATQQARLVEALAGERIELTTDMSFSQEQTRLFDGERRRYRAIVFVGDQRFLPASTGLLLRQYVESGGRLLTFGLDSFRRTVKIEPRGSLLRRGRLAAPSDRTARDVFGEVTEIERIPLAPVVPFSDPLSVFAGPAGLFTRFEESDSRVGDAEVLLAAGRDEAHPAVFGYKLGRGEVYRVGAEGWGAQLERPNVAAATRRLIEVILR